MSEDLPSSCCLFDTRIVKDPSAEVEAAQIENSKAMEKLLESTKKLEAAYKAAGIPTAKEQRKEYKFIYENVKYYVWMAKPLAEAIRNKLRHYSALKAKYLDLQEEVDRQDRQLMELLNEI